jgi:hypothetical protein
MSNRDLQNEMLDQIGRRLLKAARANDEEIEKIVAAPDLFDSLKKRIAIEEKARRKTRFFFADWTSAFFWNRQTAAGAAAVLIVLFGGASLFVFKKQNSPQVAKQIIESKKVLSTNQPSNTRKENALTVFEIKQTNVTAAKKQTSVERIALKAEKPKTPVRAPKPDLVKPVQEVKKQTQEIFYSLSTAGNWEDTGEDLQIVRTELTRSELFALGVNLPVENEAPKVRTDLLVSADGTARAIRFVE